MTKKAASAAERQRKYRESRVTLKVESAGVGFLMAQALSKELKDLNQLASMAQMRGESFGEILKTMKAVGQAIEDLEAHARFLMELEQERQEAELAKVNAGLAMCCEADSGVAKD